MNIDKDKVSLWLMVIGIVLIIISIFIPVRPSVFTVDGHEYVTLGDKSICHKADCKACSQHK